MRIGAGATGALTVRFDPSEEPDFRGGLAVDLVGQGADGIALFRAQAHLRVNLSTDPVSGGPSLGEDAILSPAGPESVREGPRR